MPKPPRRPRRFLLLLAALPAFAPPIAGRAAPWLDAGSSSAVQVSRDGLAVGGHDPVAYAEYGRPVPGNRRYTLNWNGATYRFASPESMALFRAAPELFAPQFGGFSAVHVAERLKLAGDPRHFSVIDRRLYLHTDEAAKRRFETGPAAHIARAVAVWPAIRYTPPRDLPSRVAR